MRCLAGCKRVLQTRWCINLAIAFALFILFYQTRNFARILYEQARENRDSVDDTQTASQQEGENFIRDSVSEDEPIANDDPGVRNNDFDDEVNDDHVSNDKVVMDERLNTGENVSVSGENIAGTGPRDSKQNEGQAHIPTSTSPPFIVILGQWRFGSSIIGELFNQNPDMFFLFEPLWLVDILRKEGKLPISPFSEGVHNFSTRVLRDFAKCEFSPEFVRVTNRWGGLIKNRAMCQVTNKRNGCKIPNPELIKDACLKYKGQLATKVIRADLANIKPLIVEDKVNVKVIHLVRDPRGAAASRIHYYFEYWKELVKPHTAQFPKLGRLAPLGLNNYTLRPKDGIPSMCKWMRDNVKTDTGLPDWLRDRYRLVRYEDFAESPVETTEQLYRFVGVPMPESVKDWVVANTQVKNSASGTFSMRKNSSATSKRWLFDLSELEIRQVEVDCMDVMQVLGYEPYASLKSS